MGERVVTPRQLGKGFAVLVNGSVISGLPYRVLSRTGGVIVVEEPEVTDEQPGYIVLNHRRVIATP